MMDKIMNKIGVGLGILLVCWVIFIWYVSQVPPLGFEIGYGGFIVMGISFLIFSVLFITTSILTHRFVKQWEGAPSFIYLVPLWLIMFNFVWGTWALQMFFNERSFLCSTMISGGFKDRCYIAQAKRVGDAYICEKVSAENQGYCFRENGLSLSAEIKTKVMARAMEVLASDPLITVNTIVEGASRDKATDYASLAVYLKDLENHVITSDLYSHLGDQGIVPEIRLFAGGYVVRWSESGNDRRKTYSGRIGEWTLTMGFSRELEKQSIHLFERLSGQGGGDMYSNDDVVGIRCFGSVKCPEGYFCKSYNGPAFGNEETRYCVVDKAVVVQECKYPKNMNVIDTQCPKGTACQILGVFEGGCGGNICMGCIPHRYLKRLN